jgi:hypothetical protein
MRLCGMAGGTGQTAKVLTFYCTRLTLHSFIQLAIIQTFVPIHCIALGSSPSNTSLTFSSALNLLNPTPAPPIVPRTPRALSITSNACPSALRETGIHAAQHKEQAWFRGCAEGSGRGRGERVRRAGAALCAVAHLRTSSSDIHVIHIRARVA